VLPNVVVHDIRRPIVHVEETAPAPAPQPVHEPKGGGTSAAQVIHDIATGIIAAGQLPAAGRGQRARLAKQVQRELKTRGINRRIDTIRRALPPLPGEKVQASRSRRSPSTRTASMVASRESGRPRM
jgi:hypothetical protein